VITANDDKNDLEMNYLTILGIAFNTKRYLRKQSTENLSLLYIYALLCFLRISKA